MSAACGDEGDAGGKVGEEREGRRGLISLTGCETG
jgi:hypothetical protein